MILVFPASEFPFSFMTSATVNLVFFAGLGTTIDMIFILPGSYMLRDLRSSSRPWLIQSPSPRLSSQKSTFDLISLGSLASAMASIALDALKSSMKDMDSMAKRRCSLVRSGLSARVCSSDMAAEGHSLQVILAKLLDHFSGSFAWCAFLMASHMAFSLFSAPRPIDSR